MVNNVMDYFGYKAYEAGIGAVQGAKKGALRGLEGGLFLVSGVLTLEALSLRRPIEDLVVQHYFKLVPEQMMLDDEIDSDIISSAKFAVKGACFVVAGTTFGGTVLGTIQGIWQGLNKPYSKTQ